MRETSLFKTSYLTFGDTAQYELDQVLEFSTEDGHFRRVPDKDVQFAKRVSEGNRISR